MALNESRKRTIPCTGCKRNKVRCQYVEGQPCERCAKFKLKCYFPDHRYGGSEAFSTVSQPEHQMVPPSILPHFNAPGGHQREAGWAGSVDNRISTLESALESVLSILQTSQSQQQQQMDFLQLQFQERHSSSVDQPFMLPSAKEPYRETDKYPLLGYRETLDVQVSETLSQEDARELVRLFRETLAPRLFGYDIGILDVDAMWKSSSLLLLSICTVACPHHTSLKSKFDTLNLKFKFLASQCLTCEIPVKQVENTVLALLIGALWLESSQMFTSIAIQLARIHRIDQQNPSHSILQSKRFHRLWYLLYIVDGNQNLTFEKSPSIHERSEQLLQNARRDIVSNLVDPLVRKILNENQDSKDKVVNNRQLELLNEVETHKVPISPTSLNDLRILGQVEYHMAVESIFSFNPMQTSNTNEALESAMFILQPSNFGIPWESNLKLDRWMISWTITLQNLDFQSDPWSLKATLLYYNFARMHINAKPLLARGKSSMFDVANKDFVSLWQSSSACSISDDDPSSLVDASHEISRSAAYSLLRLATEDNDIKSIFQFLPMHVHVMLYYASLVLLNPGDINADSSQVSCKSLAIRYKVVINLRKMITAAPLSDPRLRQKLLDSLSYLLEEYKKKCMDSLSDPEHVTSSRVQELFEDVKPGAHASKPKAILAWPGTNPGHP
ncbi:LADA_0H14796g1_1 [Lachancea dasiensis]|uniref:LADA_0H14796g1_1 n=1 Tax=Lachancea dasiensis TaxID=1072105 RepID=A0A1G4K4J5_9SACH|nr:LADA_0H14796g1_1 [Lachancea dasiensis]